MSKLPQRMLEKADNLANWSFIGIFVPIIGWVLTGLGYSTVNKVADARGDLEQYQITIRQKLRTSLGLSILVSLIAIALVVYGGGQAAKIQQDIETQQRRAELRQQEEATREATRQQLARQQRHNDLVACIDRVDQVITERFPGRQSAEAVHVAMALKQQFTEECKVRFPE